MGAQQVGNAWAPGGDIVSLALSGDLNVFDPRVGDKPARVLKVRRPRTTFSARV